MKYTEFCFSHFDKLTQSIPEYSFEGEWNKYCQQTGSDISHYEFRRIAQFFLQEGMI